MAKKDQEPKGLVIGSKVAPSRAITIGCETSNVAAHNAVAKALRDKPVGSGMIGAPVEARQRIVVSLSGIPEGPTTRTRDGKPAKRWQPSGSAWKKNRKNETSH